MCLVGLAPSVKAAIEFLLIDLGLTGLSSESGDSLKFLGASIIVLDLRGNSGVSKVRSQTPSSIASFSPTFSTVLRLFVDFVAVELLVGLLVDEGCVAAEGRSNMIGV